MAGWLNQFPAGTRAVIRELSVPKRNPVPRKERREAERVARKERAKSCRN